MNNHILNEWLWAKKRFIRCQITINKDKNKTINYELAQELLVLVYNTFLSVVINNIN